MGSVSPNKQISWQHSVDERLGLIKDTLGEDADLDSELPGLQSLLADYLDDNKDVDNVQFYRRSLQIFRDSPDQAYNKLIRGLTENERDAIESFVEGRDINDVNISAPLMADHMEDMASKLALSISPDGSFPEAPESLGYNGSPGDDKYKAMASDPFIEELSKNLKSTRVQGQESEIKVLKDIKFENWGLNIGYVPSFTCVPTNVRSIQAIVQAAALLDMGVRCAGFRHTWAPIFGRHGQILISLLDPDVVTKLCSYLPIDNIPLPPPNELETIDVVPNTPKLTAAKGNTLIRVGTSCTNERLRRWCVEQNKYTLPLNVIMVEITVGGTNAPICHGAGLRHQTLSDLVRCVEYVDCNGKLQTIQDPDQLQAAAGCFGLMGNIRVLDVEVEMPIPAKAKAEGSGPDVPDFGAVRRAWWDAILKCYEHTDKCPQRLPLEMRIMGDSNIVMAPQRDNTFGTCAIEIITLENAKPYWDEYAQDVLNKWMSYTDRDGKRLRTRPHWAKQWAQFSVDGKPWQEKLREDYKDEIVEFKGLLTAIGKEHGWTLGDLKKRFSNDLFDLFYFDDVVTKKVNGV